jgi:hypothetical protein
MNRNFHIVPEHAFTLVLKAGRQHFTRFSLSLLLLLTFSHGYASQLVTNSVDTQQTSLKPEGSPMWVTVGEHRFAAILADTKAAREFAAMLPLTLDMDDLHSNEKHVKLAKSLSTNEYQPGTIHNGDLMLWGSRTMVVFYKDFDTTYSYTRIGHIVDTKLLPQALGSSKVMVKFSKD